MITFVGIIIITITSIVPRGVLGGGSAGCGGGGGGGTAVGELCQHRFASAIQ